MTTKLRAFAPLLRGRAWLAYLLAGSVAVAVYTQLTSLTVKTVFILAIVASGPVVVAAGMRVHGQVKSRAWRLALAGSGLLLVDWIAFQGYIQTHDGVAPPLSSWWSFLALGIYPLLLGVLLLLLWRREPGVAGFIDVGIIAASLATIAWVVLIHAYASDQSLTVGTRAVQVAFGFADVAVFAVLVRVLATPGRRSPAYLLLVGGALAYLASNFTWNWSTRLDEYTPGSWADAGWLLFPVLLGAAALHGSMRTLFLPAATPARPLRWGHLALLVAASVVTPVVVGLDARGQASVGELTFIAAMGGALSLLVLARLALLLREQEALARTLAEQTAGLRQAALVLEASDAAIMSLDEGGRIRSWNPAAAELFGYLPSEAIGEHVSILNPPEDDPVTTSSMLIAEMSERHGVKRLETRRMRKDGSVVPVSLALSTMRDADDRVSGYTGIIRDLSDRMRHEAEREYLLAATVAASEELERQNVDLRELDRLKDDFVASVSHELRTPLTSIRGYLDLVLEGEVGELNEEQSQFLTVVDRNADRLLRVVGDLLFVAQVGERQLDLSLEGVALEDVVSEAVDAARPHAESKEILLTVEPGAVPMLSADRARLGQVLDNLLSNAIKFTPAGGRVSVRTFARDEVAVIEVADTGTGVSPEDQAKLFERFYRTRSAMENAVQGTGLGLTIVQAIVEAHGGTIAVESVEGEGTTFRVELPLERVGATA